MPLTDQQLAGISLVTFTFQNAAFVLLMRQSKLMNTGYNSTVAVLMMEILKLPLAFALLVRDSGLAGAFEHLRKDIIEAPFDTLKIAIPAVLYTIQNNALFVAVANLEAVIFQVTYQLKTLTTAIFTVALLNRKILSHQWFALMLLMAGTLLVQEPAKPKQSGIAGASNFMVGFTATIAACLCSAAASVYLEKILIESKPSIWVRNIQLCIFTIPVAFVTTALSADDVAIREGPTHGFNSVVWTAIVTNAMGGMLVAVVMKFAGNILRNFAQACAIIVGGIGSAVLFDFQITARFVGGVGLVIASIFLYGSKKEQVDAWRAQLCASASGEAAYEGVPLDEEEPVRAKGAPSPLARGSAGEDK